MFHGKRARGKRSCKPIRHTDSSGGWAAVCSTWRPESHLSQAPWQSMRARLPLQQIQSTPYEQLQQVNSTRFTHPLIQTSVARPNQIDTSPVTVLSAQHPSTSGIVVPPCSNGQHQDFINLSSPSNPNLPQNLQEGSSSAFNDINHQKSLPFGSIMGVLLCSCGASLCPSFGIHRCNCDSPLATVNTAANNSDGNNTDISISQSRHPQSTPFQSGNHQAGTPSKSRIRGRNNQKSQQLQRVQLKQDGALTAQVRPINSNIVNGVKQTRVVTTTRNVPWPFFGRRTEQLFVSGGTAFPCVHIRPAELVVDVHYSLVVDLVPRDPPLGYNISTPSARYLPPLNYLTGATWMAHPWKLHLETIVHAVQAPKLGSHGVDICLPDGEYTPVIRLFTTRAHTGLTGGHPSDMIEIGLRWYLTDHSFVKASLPGAEQPVLFRARRPLSSQYQQSGVMPTVRSPAPSYMYLHNTGGVSAVPRGHLTVVASNADLPANANHVPTERCHSYLKTRWLLSSEESRNENLLTTPSAISGSVYNTLSSKSSSVIYTPESFASGSSMNASSVFSEEIARSSSALTKNSSAPFMSEDPALVNLFNSFFPQGFFDDDHRHHPP